jgi:hypothetical protein
VRYRSRGIPLDFNTPLAYVLPMYAFIESTIFERELPNYLDDSDYAELQWCLIEPPEVGAVIPGTGGVRKLGWMLTIYAKSRHGNIPAPIVKALKERFSNEL